MGISDFFAEKVGFHLEMHFLKNFKIEKVVPFVAKCLTLGYLCKVSGNQKLLLMTII